MTFNLSIKTTVMALSFIMIPSLHAMESEEVSSTQQPEVITIQNKPLELESHEDQLYTKRALKKHLDGRTTTEYLHPCYNPRSLMKHEIAGKKIVLTQTEYCKATERDDFPFGSYGDAWSDSADSEERDDAELKRIEKRKKAREERRAALKESKNNH